MWAYMTNGTWDFLQRLADKYKQYNFFFMESETSPSTLAYYETDQKKRSIFSSGRSYEILVKSGKLQEEGYFVMNNIPLTEDGKPIFENRLKNKGNYFDHVKGFISFRLLKPLKGDTYIIFTQWETKEDYENWKESNYSQHLLDEGKIKKPAYFSSRPFITYYSLFYEEDEEECMEKSDENE